MKKGRNFDEEKKYKSYLNDTIISYGIILFSKDNKNGTVFLLYQRRDSFEYMDFMRGMWNTEEQASQLFTLMSHEERNRIRDYTFDELWDDLWVVQDSRLYKEGYIKSKRKYDTIKSSIPNILDTTVSCVDAPPWGFPKGKKNHNELPIDCAIREFEEETKISFTKNNCKIISEIPLVENFKGSDGRKYTTHYYISQIESPVYSEPMNTPHCIRKTTISEEASKIGWFNISECKKYVNNRRMLILNKVMEIMGE